MVTVPYISTWSEETTERPHRVLDFLGRVAYHDERPSDRDEHGVLWTRITHQPGQGQPQLGMIHSLRQREVMRDLRCQVCAGPADRNQHGVLFVVHDDRGGPDDWPGWPDDMAAVHPPLCLPCARRSVRMCPHLNNTYVAVRVKHHPIVGVYGALYDPRNPHRLLGDGIVAYDHHEIRWTIASQLVRTLHGCQPTDLKSGTATRQTG
jgi:hypothetical protein